MNSNIIRQTVEQFHLLFLSQFGQKIDKRLYALKGGCNLRFFLRSPRYSEDMDLDVQTIGLQTLRNKVNQLLTSETFQRILAAKNIFIATYSEPKQTATTQRWKLSLRTSDSTLSIHTKLEFSRRHRIEGARTEMVSPEIIRLYQLPPIIVTHYPAITACRQKIQALALRTQTQARDVFDLYILLINSEINHAALADVIHTDGHQAKNQAMNLSFADFKGQVLAYLPLEDQQQYVDHSIWDNIILQVSDLLEGT